MTQGRVDERKVRPAGRATVDTGLTTFRVLILLGFVGLLAPLLLAAPSRLLGTSSKRWRRQMVVIEGAWATTTTTTVISAAKVAAEVNAHIDDGGSAAGDSGTTPQGGPIPAATTDAGGRELKGHDVSGFRQPSADFEHSQEQHETVLRFRHEKVLFGGPVSEHAAASIVRATARERNTRRSRRARQTLVRKAVCSRDGPVMVAMTPVEYAGGECTEVALDLDRRILHVYHSASNGESGKHQAVPLGKVSASVGKRNPKLVVLRRSGQHLATIGQGAWRELSGRDSAHKKRVKASTGSGSSVTMTNIKASPGSTSATAAAAGSSDEHGECESANFDSNFATEAFFTRGRSSNKSSRPSRVPSSARRFYRRAMSVALGGGSCESGGGDIVSTFRNNGSSAGQEGFFDASPTCILRGEWSGNTAGTEERTGAGHERVPSNAPRPTPPAQAAPRQGGGDQDGGGDRSAPTMPSRARRGEEHEARTKGRAIAERAGTSAQRDHDDDREEKQSHMFVTALSPSFSKRKAAETPISSTATATPATAVAALVAAAGSRHVVSFGGQHQHVPLDDKTDHLHGRGQLFERQDLPRNTYLAAAAAAAGTAPSISGRRPSPEVATVPKPWTLAITMKVKTSTAGASKQGNGVRNGSRSGATNQRMVREPVNGESLTARGTSPRGGVGVRRWALLNAETKAVKAFRTEQKAAATAARLQACKQRWGGLKTARDTTSVFMHALNDRYSDEETSSNSSKEGGEEQGDDLSQRRARRGEEAGLGAGETESENSSSIWRESSGSDYSLSGSTSFDEQGDRDDEDMEYCTSSTSTGTSTSTCSTSTSSTSATSTSTSSTSTSGSSGNNCEDDDVSPLHLSAQDRNADGTLKPSSTGRHGITKMATLQLRRLFFASSIVIAGLQEHVQARLVDLFVKELPKVEVRIVADIANTFQTVQIMPPSLVVVAWAALASTKAARDFLGDGPRGLRGIQSGLPVIVVGGEDDGEVPSSRGRQREGINMRKRTT
eukprot:g2824.t1